MTPDPASFDGRAGEFDRRSAPPAEAAVDIAQAVDEMSRDAAPGAVLDLGAGTGALGAPLARCCAARGVVYLALDVSLGMLARFRGHLSGAQPVSRIRADASRVWPIADGSTGAIFAARAAHLLDAGRFLEEVRRVLVPGGVLLLGAVRRSPESPRAQLRRKLHALLAEHGIRPRSARRRHGELATLVGPGDPPQTVASWTVTESLELALSAWQRPGHLIGRDVPALLRREVLEDLHTWALDRWTVGRYDAGHPLGETHPRPTLQTTERFEITVVRPNPSP
ncbi:MAG: class I SAM-dependent methyltransferase [Thermoanaerobaculia bacterium]|nr:class I SAM-dependent methyltransferase [Thermoanaerobaculia bacterium]